MRVSSHIATPETCNKDDNEDKNDGKSKLQTHENVPSRVKENARPMLESGKAATQPSSKWVTESDITNLNTTEVREQRRLIVKPERLTATFKPTDSTSKQKNQWRSLPLEPLNFEVDFNEYSVEAPSHDFDDFSFQDLPSVESLDLDLPLEDWNLSTWFILE